KANDCDTGVKTFASLVANQSAKHLEWPLLGVELLAFGSMLMYINLPIVYIFLLGYGLIAYFRARFFALRPVVFLAPANRPYQLIMLDGYQIFLPLALLVHMALTQPWGWIILIIHIAMLTVDLMCVYSVLTCIISIISIVMYHIYII